MSHRGGRLPDRKNAAALLWFVASMFLAPRSALAADPRVVVILTDSTRVIGVLREWRVDLLRVDPDGPVTLRAIDAGDVARLVFPDTGASLERPWSPSAMRMAFDAAARRAPVETDVPGTPATRRARDAREGSGFRRVTLHLSGGVSRASAGSDGSYYQGYGSGPSFEGGLRFFFPREDARQSRPFVGIRYGRTRLAVREPLLTTTDGGGNTLELRFEDLTVGRFGLDLGITTRTMGSDSYLHALVGFSAMSNSASVTGTVYAPGGPPAGVRVTVTEGRTGLRFGVGGMIGLRPRLGIDIATAADLLFGPPEEIPGYGQRVPTYHGALLDLRMALVLDL